MFNFFKCKVRYQKMLETGMEKTVTEEYLVDSLSWSEAEKKITEEMEAFISGEFSISDISRFKVSETFLSDKGDRYFKAKLHFITLDEKSGSEKKQSVYALVQADEIGEAKEIIEREMNKTMIDYEIPEIKETKILDVFTYQGDGY